MENFMFGTATSAYQIEGANKEDGKGLSIWDEFSHQEGKIADGTNGDVTCDSYHRFEEDLALLKELGVTSYRFSLSWARIMPEGQGKVNEKGLAFYSHFIDRLLEEGITPVITLFHWDLPSALQKEGGFLSEKMPKWFADYADVCTKAFGDRVKFWITINEPQCIIGNGYSAGIHAPGLKLSDKECLQCVHNLLKAHGEAVKVIRKNVKDSKVTFASTGNLCAPYEFDNKILIEAARKESFKLPDKGNPFFSVSLYCDPLYLGNYPKDYYVKYASILPVITPSDLELIHQPLDYLSHNIYTANLLYLSYGEPSFKRPIYAIEPRKADIWWEPVIPESLYFGPKFLYERYHLPIIITENGMCDNTGLSADGKIHDKHRCIYISEYFEMLKKAKKSGVDIAGYFYWSLMDNFEWAEGNSKRFGLVYMDYQSGKRTKKDSFAFYQNLIKENKKI
jgi:beta-glucosidase